MTRFRKVIQDHHLARLAGAEAARVLELQTQEIQRKFRAEFCELASSMARPIFEQFAAELSQEGLRAEVEQATGEAENPSLSVRFTCEPSAAASTDCLYRITGDTTLLKVQRLMRIGRDAHGVGTSYPLQSITAGFINQQLSEALKRGLEQPAGSEAES